MTAANPFKETVQILRQQWSQLALLPLQSIHHFNFTTLTKRRNNYDLLIEVMEKIPAHIGVIITQHPDEKLLTTDTLTWLQQKYKNLLFIADTEETYAPSQYLLPLVDGLVVLSSGLAYQALMWRKPIIRVAPSHFNHLHNAYPIEQIETALANPYNDADEKILFWHLTHYNMAGCFQFNGEWMNRTLQLMLQSWRSGVRGRALFPSIADDATILYRLAQTRRPPRLQQKPPSQSCRIRLFHLLISCCRSLSRLRSNIAAIRR